MEVGIRQLRDQLSRYLDRVREGEEIVVTDHGRAIARLVPLGEQRLIDRLVTEGVVTPASKQQRSRPKQRIEGAEVTDLVAQQRR